MNKQQQQTSIFIMALLLSLLLVVTTHSLDVISVYASPVTIFSTRDNFDTTNGQENTTHTLPTAADLLGDLGQICPGEIVIYVHGVWSNNQSALEQVERVDISLAQGNDYDVAIVGFSWEVRQLKINDNDRLNWEIALDNNKSATIASI